MFIERVILGDLIVIAGPQAGRVVLRAIRRCMATAPIRWLSIDITVNVPAQVAFVSGRISSESDCGRDGLGGCNRHHFADRIDHQIGFVEMNPMRTGVCDHLLHIVADAA